jgi:mannose-6-phosphate isomerase
MSINNIEKFPIQVYRLKNKIQNYSWGTKGKNAFIPNFIGLEAEDNIPYAELWIGAHPKLPSEILINDKYYPLNGIIEKFPNEILGSETARKFNNKLPFLLKILSIGKALSIQAHPNKELAKILHKKDPQNYPDENHKPEIAIAIDKLELLIGFKPLEEIYATIEKYSALKNVLSFKLSKTIFNKSDDEKREIIKRIYSNLMKLTAKQVNEIIPKIIQQINENKELSFEEKEFLKQQKQNGNDIGLFSIFLFNLITLKKEEALFTKAGIPHAYLRGNIIECMANSDNVVRAGLTSKYKDIPTLLKMLTYDFSPVEIIRDSNKNEVFTYQSLAEEFEITMYSLFENKTIVKDNNIDIAILLVLENNIKVEWENGLKKINVKKGEAVLIPAKLTSYKILSNKNAKFICVNVP